MRSGWIRRGISTQAKYRTASAFKNSYLFWRRLARDPPHSALSGARHFTSAARHPPSERELKTELELTGRESRCNPSRRRRHGSGRSKYIGIRLSEIHTIE